MAASTPAGLRRELAYAADSIRGRMTSIANILESGLPFSESSAKGLEAAIHEALVAKGVDSAKADDIADQLGESLHQVGVKLRQAEDLMVGALRAVDLSEAALSRAVAVAKSPPAAGDPPFVL